MFPTNHDSHARHKRVLGVSFFHTDKAKTTLFAKKDAVIHPPAAPPSPEGPLKNKNDSSAGGFEEENERFPPREPRARRGDASGRKNHPSEPKLLRITRIIDTKSDVRICWNRRSCPGGIARKFPIFRVQPIARQVETN